MIPSESDISHKSSASSTHVSSLSRNNSNANGKSQLAGANLPSQQTNFIPKSVSRDSLKGSDKPTVVVVANGKMATSPEDEQDSEDEKLSPLLNKNGRKTQQPESNEQSALKIDGVGEHIDDGEEEEEEDDRQVMGKNESPKDTKKSLSTPMTSLKETAASLPGKYWLTINTKLTMIKLILFFVTFCRQSN